MSLVSNWMTYSPCGILNEFELTLSRQWVWNEASGIRRLQISRTKTMCYYILNKHHFKSGQTTNSFGAFEQRSIWQACSEQRQQSSKHTSNQVEPRRCVPEIHSIFRSLFSNNTEHPWNGFNEMWNQNTVITIRLYESQANCILVTVLNYRRERNAI